jgi:hypothetical protein
MDAEVGYLENVAYQFSSYTELQKKSHIYQYCQTTDHSPKDFPTSLLRFLTELCRVFPPSVEI